MGFKINLSVRIGLHTALAREIIQGGEVTNVTGENINITARIEPIVDPNEVFCSDMFYHYLNVW